MTTTATIKFIVAMIIMMNPLGSLSIFIDLTKKYSHKRQAKIAQQAAIAILVIMLISLWTGNALLTFFGIRIASFRVAGGLILILMGLSMLKSQESPVSHTADDDEAAKESPSIAVVPLALPVIVGPGAISTLIIAADDVSDLNTKLILTCICILLTILMAFMLHNAALIAKVVGNSVMKVVTRIMGMIIMAIAVGMIADGIAGLFPALIS